MTKFAPHKALNLIARCKLTFNEVVILHCVEGMAVKVNLRTEVGRFALMVRTGGGLLPGKVIE